MLSEPTTYNVSEPVNCCKDPKVQTLTGDNIYETPVYLDHVAVVRRADLLWNLLAPGVRFVGPAGGLHVGRVALGLKPRPAAQNNQSCSTPVSVLDRLFKKLHVVIINKIFLGPLYV